MLGSALCSLGLRAAIGGALLWPGGGAGLGPTRSFRERCAASAPVRVAGRAAGWRDRAGGQAAPVRRAGAGSAASGAAIRVGNAQSRPQLLRRAELGGPPATGPRERGRHSGFQGATAAVHQCLAHACTLDVLCKVALNTYIYAYK